MESACCSVDVELLSKSGSRDVWSLVMDEALALRMELASVMDAAALRNGTDMPDIDDADEARPATGIVVNHCDLRCILAGSDE